MKVLEKKAIFKKLKPKEKEKSIRHVLTER